MRKGSKRKRGLVGFAFAALFVGSLALLVLPAGCLNTFGIVIIPCEDTSDCTALPGTRCLDSFCTCIGEGVVYCDYACKPEAECSKNLANAPECAADVDCPQPDRRCGVAICANGKCAPLVIRGPTPSQLRGDCLKTECDETGSVLTISDAEDAYDDGNPCTVDVCTSIGMAHEPYPDGSPCLEGTRVCVLGNCSACNDVTDCGDPTLECDNTKNCVPEACANPMQDVGESDLNCGGSCSPCEVGAGCLSGYDCVSGVCFGQTCAEPSCTDGARNGLETDVDCGTAECGACADGKRCESPIDCESSVCWAGVCLPATCFDAVRNGGESGDDCGGPCAPCSP